MRVAVAVDPEASAETAEKLSLPLLQLARSLADSCDGELRIVSCWDYELEGFLRRNSWVSLPAEHVSSSVLRAGDHWLIYGRNKFTDAKCLVCYSR